MAAAKPKDRPMDSTLAVLRAWMAEHRVKCGNLEFICDVCQKTLSSKSSLARHERSCTQLRKVKKLNNPEEVIEDSEDSEEEGEEEPNPRGNKFKKRKRGDNTD